MTHCRLSTLTVAFHLSREEGETGDSGFSFFLSLFL